MYNEASRKATNKYQKDHLEIVSFRVKKGEREYFKNIAAKAGLSLKDLFTQAIKEFEENHGL